MGTLLVKSDETGNVVTWGDEVFRIRWVLPEVLSAEAMITTAHGYCFDNGRLLVVENKRGFELPGGHLEPGEDYMAALKREVFEEACVHVGRVRLLGYLRVDSLATMANAKYPLVSYMAFCKAEIVKSEKFRARYECMSRDYIEPFELRKKHHNWLESYEPSLAAALAS